MNRTTKAMARLGTLAVVAGSALSAPFAVGAANAAVPITFTVTGVAPATNGGQTTAANAAARTDDAAHHISVTPGGFSGTLTMVLTGSSAYFANPLPAGYTGGGQTVTCAAPCAGGAILVDDNVAEAAGLGASDTAGDVGSTTLKFNGISFSGCTTTDIDTTANCVTQGQVGTAIPVVVHYAAGQSGATDTDGAFRTLVVSVAGPGGSTSPTIVGAPPGNPQTINCTTDASGNCTVNIVDSNPLDTDNTAVTGQLGHDTITTAIAQASTPNYPGVGTVASLFGVAVATAGPQEALNITSGSVAPARMDLVSAQMIAPTAQDANAVNAEPGDAVQLTYLVTGSCTPATGNATCTGQPLAGSSLNLSVDHGFFTPNCEQTQSDDPGKLTLNFYGSCSFTTAPAAGGQVGSLTNSGTTKTVSTNIAGQFVVTIGIGRDSAFDQSGAVVAHVTEGTGASKLGATVPVASAKPTANVERTTAQNCTASKDVVAPIATPGSAPDFSGCPADIEWVTNEQPLNGGTAKYSVIAPLSSPNNVAISTENNYAATDSGTVNVPDVGRVAFQVKMTDQFGNLVSYTLGSAPATLKKSGPGGVGQCVSSSSTDACGGAVAPAGSLPYAAQPDGTGIETVPAVVGTYLNLPTSVAGPDARYQADVKSQSGGAFNDGYGTGTPSVNDGTQTDVLSWAAPTTTFKTQTAGIWSYSAGTATAASDTLTLNFYNQLAQPVVTFNVLPGNHVATSTAVTVAATVVDQFKNPLVGQTVDALRSGSNESSCVPVQSTIGPGGGLVAPLATNTSGTAAYTFSCNAPGVSTVNMVVVGPGQIQLAAGKEAITFGGSGQQVTTERPKVSLTSFHKHHLTVHVSTSPRLGALRTVNVYRLTNGLKHLVGQTHTGPRGNAALTFRGLRSGATWTIAVKVVNLSSQYNSQFSKAVSHRIK